VPWQGVRRVRRRPAGRAGLRLFQGARHEDAGVVTEPEWRGRGLATACARAWCAAVVARGRAPTRTTSPDNVGSWRIAERLGFELVRRDVLRVIGVEVPR